MRISYPEIALIFVLTICAQVGFSQHQSRSIDRYSRLFLLRSDTLHHGAFQGLPENWYSVDTIKGFEPVQRYSNASRKLFDAHNIEVEAPDFKAYADLLLHFEVGDERKLDNDYHDTTRMSRNMRGFRLMADIGDKVSFETSFREMQSYVPYYLYNYSNSTQVMPGAGRIKPFNATGRDHAVAEGYVAYAPVDNVSILFGNTQNFIGSGYRSLLLSDVAYTYPQIKLSWHWKKAHIRYHTIHAWLQTLNRLPNGNTPEPVFSRKQASFHYLEFQPIPQVTLGLFEGTVWRTFVPKEGPIGLPGAAYSPVIFTGLVTVGLDNPDQNLILGLDLSTRPIDELMVYGQLVLDGQNRKGFQFGMRTIDLGVDGLSLRAEYNTVDPYTYGPNRVLQEYGHFGQQLAHPMGAGFDELSAGLTYFKSRWYIDARYVSADQLIDVQVAGEKPCTAGGDINIQQHCRDIHAQSDAAAHLNQVDMRVGYFFNPSSNFNAFLGWSYRDRKGAGVRQYQSIYSVGIEMYLFNRYEDF